MGAGCRRGWATVRAWLCVQSNGCAQHMLQDNFLNKLRCLVLHFEALQSARVKSFHWLYMLCVYVFALVSSIPLYSPPLSMRMLTGGWKHLGSWQRGPGSICSGKPGLLTSPAQAPHKLPPVTVNPAGLAYEQHRQAHHQDCMVTSQLCCPATFLQGLAA